MRKKYLSALLFGALLFASAGTFTSCKDYDDDISNLQGQINDVNTAITELQSAVEGGKYVTAVSNTGNTITFTFSDGTTTQVALEDQVGSVVTVQDGVLYIDGEATDIKVAEPAPTPEPGEEHKDQIIIENNMWSVLQEDGTYKTTNIPVSGVSVSGSEAEGFTFRVYASDGTYKDVKLPSATSSITDLILNADGNATGTIQGKGKNMLVYATYSFDNYPEDLDTKKWKGPRALPARGTKIVSGNTQISLQVNPTNVDGTIVEFKLVDSQNNYPSNLSLKATEDTRLLTSRAANGLYLLGMEDKMFADEIAAAAYTSQFTTNSDKKLYAVAAGEARSAYGVTVQQGSQQELYNLNIYKNNNESSPLQEDVTIGGTTDILNRIDINTWYYIKPEQIGAFYDMYVTDANDDDAVLFGLEFKNEEGNYAFRATKTPDNVSKTGFGIVVTTVDKNGNSKNTTVNLNLSEKITEGLTYDAIPYQINSNKDADKNRFSIDLNDMKEYLGTEGLALWNTKVEAMSVTFKNATTGAIVGTGSTDSDSDEDYKNEQAYVTAAGITVTPVKEVKDGTSANVTALKDAKFLKFAIDNATASSNFVIGQQYNAVISFKDKDNGDQLNSITIPFTLTLPEITSLFQLDQKLVEDGAAICYLYEEDFMDVNRTNGAASFMLSRVFQKIESTGFQVALDSQAKVGETDKTSAELAQVAMVKGTAVTAEDTEGKVNFKHNNDSETYVTLTGNRANGTGLNLGYGEVLTLHVTGKYAGYWAYPVGQNTFTFKVKVLSPIYEGQVTPKEGNVVTIPATKLSGYEFGNNDITGYTYNSAISYNVLPENATTVPVWSRKEIANVTAESSNTRIFKIAENTGGWADSKFNQLFPAYTTGSGNNAVHHDGYFKLEAQQIPATVTDEAIDITVTDIWGYSKTSTVPVQITVD